MKTSVRPAKILKATRLAGMVAAISFFAVGEAWANNWVEYGPNPIIARGTMSGRMVSLALHPSKPGVVYAGAASGGVWRWDGDSWTPLTDHMRISSIGALLVDPKEPNTIYAGTGESTYSSASFYGLGIYKSTDGGESWKHYGEKELGGRSVHQMAISSKTGNIYLALAQTGEPKEHPKSKDPGGLFVSKDKGKTWKRVPGLPKWDATDVAFAPDDPDTIYVGISTRQNAKGQQHAGFYRSTDGGESWKKMPGMPKDPRKFVIAVTPADPKRVYVLGGGTSPTLFVSRDKGASFAKNKVSGLRTQINGHYDICIAADPKNADRVFTGGVQVYVSTNGGSSSRRITAPHPDIQRLLVDDKGKLYCAHDGGIHTTKDGGRRWEHANKGLSTVQIYPYGALNSADPEKMVGGLQDNGTVYRSGSKGLVWNEALGGDGGCNASHPKTPNVVFSGYYGAGNLYKSTNNGRSFSLSSSGINKSDRVSFLPPFVYHPQDSNVLFYGTQRMYKSTNQGKSWSPISRDVAGPGKAIRAIGISSDGTWLYVVTGDEKVHVSQDGGKTYKKVLDNVHGPRTLSRQISVAPWDKKVAFLGVWSFQSDPLRMTKDGGKTWTSLLGNLRKAPVNTTTAFESGKHKIVLAGTDAGIFATCDFDGLWRTVGDFFPTTPVADVQYDKKYERLVAFTFGRGAWVLKESNEKFWSQLCAIKDEDPNPDPDPEPEPDETESGGSSESDSSSNDTEDPSGSSDSSKSEKSPNEDDPSKDKSNDEPKSDDPSSAPNNDSDDPSPAPPGDKGSCGCNSASPVSAWFGGLALLGLLRRRRKSWTGPLAALALLTATPAMANKKDNRNGLSFLQQERSSGLSFALGTQIEVGLDRPSLVSWVRRAPTFNEVDLQRFVVQNPDTSQDSITTQIRNPTPSFFHRVNQVGSHVLLFCTEETQQTPLLQRYVYCNKTVIRVSDEEGRVGWGGSSVAGKTGEPAEIRALMSPDRVGVGSELPVRVYIDGQNPVGDQVTAIAPDGRHLSFPTYAMGIAHIPIDQSGIWTIRCRGDVGDTHFVGDLVFEVL